MYKLTFVVSVLRDELWINLHVSTAIVCACMPTYRPLLSRAVQATSSFRNRYSNKTGTTKASAMNDSSYSSQADSRNRRPNYAKLDGSGSDVMKLHDVAHDIQVPANAIAVKRTVEVV